MRFVCFVIAFFLLVLRFCPTELGFHATACFVFFFQAIIRVFLVTQSRAVPAETSFACDPLGGNVASYSHRQLSYYYNNDHTELHQTYSVLA